MTHWKIYFKKTLVLEWSPMDPGEVVKTSVHPKGASKLVAATPNKSHADIPISPTGSHVIIRDQPGVC
ncbi:hypothetical protein N7523_005573 [Penicillium sp. IBT 18751x]|nr:hypothetical protein N7523_005573 [Penicillium sp. IBT 18751x]